MMFRGVAIIRGMSPTLGKSTFLFAIPYPPYFLIYINQKSPKIKQKNRQPYASGSIIPLYNPMHEVAPSAVSTAVITDAMICSVHFRVSLFDINSSFLPFRFYIGVISSEVERSLHALRLVEMTHSLNRLFQAMRWRLRMS